MSNAYANRNGGRPVWDASPAPPLSSYDALRDPNMRHYFENRSVQAHLYKTGQIDAAGRVIDMSKNASKFAIIDQEFKAAEKLEYWRKKEEAEMRHRVQMKRHEALARARRAEKMAKAKEAELMKV